MRALRRRGPDDQDGMLSLASWHAVAVNRGCVPPQHRYAPELEYTGIHERLEYGADALLAERDACRLPAHSEPGRQRGQADGWVDKGLHDRVEHRHDGDRHDPADREPVGPCRVPVVLTHRRSREGEVPRFL